ncbi:MAG: hypothetical protein OEU50_09675 [Gammaproteobacteria bacterium]|jgi:hypothetical protein|nr:hypothetical protein [Gammaproteobacteria bacterium]
MNRDKKIAFILAPFLLIGGWVATDLYLESEDSPTQLFQLEATGECRLFDGDCILQSGDMQVNVTDAQGLTRVNTSYPSDRVALSLVYRDGQEVIYDLEQLANPQYWERQTDIRDAMAGSSKADMLRIVVQVKGKNFFGEFSPAGSK